MTKKEISWTISEFKGWALVKEDGFFILSRNGIRIVCSRHRSRIEQELVDWHEAGNWEQLLIELPLPYLYQDLRGGWHCDPEGLSHINAYDGDSPGAAVCAAYCGWRIWNQSRSVLDAAVRDET